jgi:hypothetical protein
MRRAWLEVLALGLICALTVLGLRAWLASKEQQRQLDVSIKAEQKIVSDASKRESAREGSLSDALDQIAKLKRETRTGSDVLRELPTYLPLPEPLIVSNPRKSTPVTRGQKSLLSAFTGDSGASSDQVPSLQNNDPAPKTGQPEPRQSATLEGPRVDLPSGDLKPLFDYVQNCRACQAEVNTARQDSRDNALKLASVTRERDSALAVAEGGGFLHRIRRDLGWFALGALSGYAASRH